MHGGWSVNFRSARSAFSYADRLLPLCLFRPGLELFGHFQEAHCCEIYFDGAREAQASLRLSPVIFCVKHGTPPGQGW